MNLFPLTVASSTPPSLGSSAPPSLGSSAPRVGFAQRLTPTGERAYGHYSADATALHASLADQPLHAGLQRWLHEHDVGEGENDDTARALPSHSTLAATLMEELFSEGHARVFCTCCNRNLTHRDVRLVHTARSGSAVHYRYLCPADHLLLALSTAQIVAVAEERAA